MKVSPKSVWSLAGGLAVCMLFAPLALGDDGVVVGRDAANRLVGEFSVPQPFVIPPSVFPGFEGFATGSFGFSSAVLDEPEHGFFTLNASSNVRAVAVAINEHLSVHNGATMLGVGGQMAFGTPFFDFHPIFQVGDHHGAGEEFSVTFVFQDSAGHHSDSAPLTVRFTVGEEHHCPADVGMQGGMPGQDGLLNNNDFIAFIDLFFAMDHGADIGQQGGVAGHDELFNNNDFIVFIDRFFAGCGH